MPQKYFAPSKCTEMHSGGVIAKCCVRRTLMVLCASVALEISRWQHKISQ